MHLNGQTGYRAVVLAALLASAAGQARPQTPSLPPVGAPPQEEMEKSATSGCYEPPPLIRWEDYRGPFARLAGTVGRKAELSTVHEPHYKPGAKLCSLEPGEKFSLFVRNTVDPISLLSAGFNAAISPGSDPSFGQGMQGYGKRFGAALADQTTARFLGGFVYPTLFREDPRYYRMAHGSTARRLGHALAHVAVGHRDSGAQMFNFSEWLGAGSAVAAGYAWHPGNAPGFGPGARSVAWIIGQDAGFNVLREFWPEIARGLRLPFRDPHEMAPAGRQ